MRIMALPVALVLSSALLVADDRSVTFDASVNFSAVKTFLVRETQVKSERPELSNSLFAKKVADAIRVELTGKGLKEATDAADAPDVIVDSRITGVDYSIGPFGRANMIGPGRGRGAPVRSDPVSFTEGTLVIDFTKGDPTSSIWHGVYRRPRDSAAKLAQNFPGYVKKLLSEYPPKKKT